MEMATRYCTYAIEEEMTRDLSEEALEVSKYYY